MPTPPVIDYCLVCEDVRAETLNKLTLLGFFGMIPHVQIMMGNVNLPSRLMFVFGTSGGDGHFLATCEVVSPEGRIVSTSNLEVDFALTQPRAIIGTGMREPFGGTGLFTLRLVLSGRSVFESNFTIQQAPADANQ